MKFLALLGALITLAAPLALAQNDAVVTRRALELRETPDDAARSLAPLAAQTPVTRQAGRQGAWVQIRTAQGISGWVHMFEVGPANAPAPASSGNAATSAMRGLTGLFDKGHSQTASTGTTSVIGIRGLGAEDIANAVPNPALVNQAEAMRADAAQARQFASAASLTAREVKALPVPSARAEPTSNSSNREAP